LEGSGERGDGSQAGLLDCLIVRFLEFSVWTFVPTLSLGLEFGI
jgi:hypothetical protein